MPFVNLTPHNVVIHSGDTQVTVAPSGQSLRVSSTMEPAGVVNGVQLYRANYGNLELIDNATKEVVSTALPYWREDTLYIVSGQCLEALKGVRSDFAAPGELVRDDKGQPVGCKGLRIN